MIELLNDELSEKVEFTVVVPTRERPDTLFFCLKNLLGQEYENYEILVSDNYSQDSTEEIVKSFNSDKIRYINTGKRISMSHNWEFALSYIKTGWVLFVGDDDGLLPSALSILNKVIAQSGCQALTMANSVFWWPNHFEARVNGELTIPISLSEIYTIKKSNEMLHKVLTGNAEYRDLPWLYNGGAASVDLLNTLRTDDGVFFHSVNPDIYSAICLSLGTDMYASINMPLAINGASKHSGGTSHMLGQKKDKNSPTSKFLAESNIPFHEKLVFGKSIFLMTYECYLQSAHLYTTPFVNLKQQIEVALVVAPKVYWLEIKNECIAICENNNIEMPSLTKVFLKRFFYKLSSLKILQKCQLVSLQATDVDVKNVYDAGLTLDVINKIIQTFCNKGISVRLLIRLFLIGLKCFQLTTKVFTKLTRSNFSSNNERVQ